MFPAQRIRRSPRYATLETPGGMITTWPRILPPVETVIVDGYVWFDSMGKPGLGGYLCEVPMTGVAAQMCAYIEQGWLTAVLFGLDPHGRSFRSRWLMFGW